MRFGAGFTAALVVSALAAAPAGASSIVYLKDGNVQLAAPDGGSAKQVTKVGGLESVTQSDDGTTFAIKKGEDNGYTVRRIYSFDRQGNLLRNPVKAGYTNASTFAGPIRAQASPDGSFIAYHYFYNSPDPGV